jgi:hypothetical protein
MAVAQLVVTVLVAAITSAGVALVTPWAQWAVETQRRRNDRRVAVIAEGRALIGEWHQYNPRNHGREFMNDPRFAVVRPHLSKETKELLGNTSVIITHTGLPSDASSPYTRAVLADLDRLEREWKLI